MHMEGSLSPSQLEATCIRRRCPDELVGGSPFARGRFDWRLLAKDPLCMGTTSRCGEGAIHGGDGGGRVAPRSTYPLSKDAYLEGASFPHLFAAHPVVRRSLSILSRPRFLTGGVSCLLPYGIHGWVGIPWLTTAAPKTLRKITSALKR
jgi:hypothetical protein